MLLPNHDTTEEHVEDMQTDTIDNNQCKYNISCKDIASATKSVI